MTETGDAPRPTSPLWRRLTAAGTALALLPTAAATGLSFLARTHWALDNLTAFVAQYAAAAAACLVVFLLLRFLAWAGAAAVVVAANAIQLVSFDTAAPAASGKPITVVSANVNFANREFGRFLAFAREADPELLVVVEVDSQWAEALEGLRDRWPHAVVVPRDDPFGIALFSRIPFEATEVVAAERTGFPSIVARVAHDGRPLTVIGTHPPPPNFGAAAANRNRQLGDLARIARDAHGEVVLTGDLNVAPWSPHFRDLLRDGRLSDSRRGLDPQTTWPTFFPPLMTPIDHVLASGAVAVVDRRVGPGIGSDHLPVVLRLVLRH